MFQEICLCCLGLCPQPRTDEALPALLLQLHLSFLLPSRPSASFPWKPELIFLYTFASQAVYLWAFYQPALESCGTQQVPAPAGAYVEPSPPSGWQGSRAETTFADDLP